MVANSFCTLKIGIRSQTKVHRVSLANWHWCEHTWQNVCFLWWKALKFYYRGSCAMNRVWSMEKNVTLPAKRFRFLILVPGRYHSCALVQRRFWSDLAKFELVLVLGASTFSPASRFVNKLSFTCKFVVLIFCEHICWKCCTGIISLTCHSMCSHNNLLRRQPVRP